MSGAGAASGWLRHGEAVLDERRGALLALARRGEPLVLRVVGACMEPQIPERSTIEVRSARWYWPGDVVAFFAGDGRFLVHRVLGYRVRGCSLALFTAADAAAGADDPVERGRVLGRVAAVIERPELGVVVTTADRRRALARYLRLAARALLRRPVLARQRDGAR